MGHLRRPPSQELQSMAMNKDTLKTINKIVLQSQSSFLVGGPSCIGKTHFGQYLKAQDGFNRIKTYTMRINRIAKNEEGGYNFMPVIKRNKSKKLRSSILMNSKEASEYYAIPGTKGAWVIMIGAPWDTWHERSILRKHPVTNKSNPVKFKEYYVKCINKLKEYNIPYILIDNRDDCPILDESSFLTMLTEENLIDT